MGLEWIHGKKRGKEGGRGGVNIISVHMVMVYHFIDKLK